MRPLTLDSLEKSISSFEFSNRRPEMKQVRGQPNCNTFSQIDKKRTRYSTFAENLQLPEKEQNDVGNIHSISKMLSQVEEEEIVNHPSPRLEQACILLSPKHLDGNMLNLPGIIELADIGRNTDLHQGNPVRHSTISLCDISRDIQQSSINPMLLARPELAYSSRDPLHRVKIHKNDGET